jgi:hypothetical protein
MDIVFNVAKGKVRHYVEQAAAGIGALVIVPLEEAGLVSDAVMRDYDDVAAIIAGASNEQTTIGRKTITGGTITTTVDDTNDRVDSDFPDPVWTNPTGNRLGALVVAYDANTGAGTDADLLPLTKHDFSVLPEGASLTGQVSASGFYRAS